MDDENKQAGVHLFHGVFSKGRLELEEDASAFEGMPVTLHVNVPHSAESKASGHLNYAGPVLEMGLWVQQLVKGNGPLRSNIRLLRQQLRHDLGFELPPVRLLPSRALVAGGYKIMIAGEIAGMGEVDPEKVMVLALDKALEPGLQQFTGPVTKDPVFGVKGKWVQPTVRRRARRLGLIVAEPAMVICSHLSDYRKALRAPAAQPGYGLQNARFPG